MGRRSARTGRGERAFTLVEATLSIVIVGVMFVAAVTTVGSAAKGRRLQAEWRRMDGLARSLLSEVVQSEYGSTGGTIIPAGALGIPTANRSGFTTIDHYADLVDSPVRARDGTPLTGYDGWSRSVTVERVDPANPAGASTRSTDKGLKRVSVAVKARSGGSMVLTALRSRWSPLDLSVAAGTTRMQGAVVRLRLKGGADVYAGAVMPNGPQVSGAGGGVLQGGAEAEPVKAGEGEVKPAEDGLISGLLGGLLGGGK